MTNYQQHFGSCILLLWGDFGAEPSPVPALRTTLTMVRVLQVLENMEGDFVVFRDDLDRPTSPRPDTLL